MNQNWKSRDRLKLTLLVIPYDIKLLKADKWCRRVSNFKPIFLSFESWPDQRWWIIAGLARYPNVSFSLTIFVIQDDKLCRKFFFFSKFWPVFKAWRAGSWPDERGWTVAGLAWYPGPAACPLCSLLLLLPADRLRPAALVGFHAEGLLFIININYFPKKSDMTGWFLHMIMIYCKKRPSKPLWKSRSGFCQIRTQGSLPRTKGDS